MPQLRSFGPQRVRSLTSWAKAKAVPGMDQQTFEEIFEYVRACQLASGEWVLPGNNWGVVMTSVVLRSLDALGFSQTDQWPTVFGQGGIGLAVNYLCQQVQGKGPDEIPEDVWDACQAILALANHQREEARRLADGVNSNWRALYESPRNHCRWFGPAYLAAIVDVLTAFDDESNTWHLRDALHFLGQLEERKGQDLLGFFFSANEQRNMTRWNTSLVVRTLCTVKPQYRDQVDPKLIERSCTWLLAELDDEGWDEDIAEEPMFLARAMGALYQARRWVGEPFSTRIDEAAARVNQRLYKIWHTEPRCGDLKAYTAVVEYLALWTVPTPAGLLFDATTVLDTASALAGVPTNVPNGLRIAWLSDLHIEKDADPTPCTRNYDGNLLTKHLRRLFHFKGTPLTAHFQAQNLTIILERVQAILPDHILVSGDLTNYAEESQFQSVRERFLQVQGAIHAARSQPLHQDGFDSAIWTILPGNHDVTNTEQAASNSYRYNLGMFAKYMRTWEAAKVSLDSTFPIHKVISKPTSKLHLHLVGLDSTRPEPVWVIGFNALGRIDGEQFDALDGLLQTRRKEEMWLVALHHHPIVVPTLLPETQDWFLSLNESDGKGLIRRCIQNGVSAILHGHFHSFSCWSGMEPDGDRYMWIVGSPAGTLTVPGHSEQFLELREASREQGPGVEVGLAVYIHKNANGTWTEQYSGIFIPAP